MGAGTAAAGIIGTFVLLGQGDWGGAAPFIKTAGEGIGLGLVAKTVDLLPELLTIW